MYQEEQSGLTGVPSKQTSQIDRAFNQVGENSRLLFDSISLLEEKLKPVLRSLNPSTQGEDCAKVENFVPLAEGVRKIGSDFSFANSRIRNLLERLEI
jgi:hypothetical protein